MKMHRFDGLSFATGLILTAIGLVFLIPNEPSDLIHGITRLGNWIWPVLLLAAGLAVLVPILLPRRDEDASRRNP